jgi:hypothetical protein
VFKSPNFFILQLVLSKKTHTRLLSVVPGKKFSSSVTYKSSHSADNSAEVEGRNARDTAGQDRAGQGVTVSLEGLPA